MSAECFYAGVGPCPVCGPTPHPREQGGATPSFGDTVTFRNHWSGEVRAGLMVRDIPEQRAIVVLVPGHREVVVHRNNIVTP